MDISLGLPMQHRIPNKFAGTRPGKIPDIFGAEAPGFFSTAHGVAFVRECLLWGDYERRLLSVASRGTETLTLSSTQYIGCISQLTSR